MITGHKRHGKNRHKYTTRLEPPKEAGKIVRLAHSKVSVLSMKEGISLVSVELLTGRTHQIRAHFADINKPLVQDELYGGKKALKKIMNGEVRNACLRIERQALHAHILEFKHPKNGKIMSFSAKMPKDLQELAALLGEKSI